MNQFKHFLSEAKEDIGKFFKTNSGNIAYVFSSKDTKFGLKPHYVEWSSDGSFRSVAVGRSGSLATQGYKTYNPSSAERKKLLGGLESAEAKKNPSLKDISYEIGGIKRKLK